MVIFIKPQTIPYCQVSNYYPKGYSLSGIWMALRHFTCRFRMKCYRNPEVLFIFVPTLPPIPPQDNTIYGKNLFTEGTF